MNTIVPTGLPKRSHLILIKPLDPVKIFKAYKKTEKHAKMILLVCNQHSPVFMGNTTGQVPRG